MKKRSIKFKGSAVILSSLVLIFSCFYFLTTHRLNTERSLHNIEDVSESKKAFEILVDEETRMLEMGLTDTIDNPEIKKLFLAKDRQKLYDYTKPLFDQQRDEMGLTHWLFHEPNGNVFLRVHKPEVFGMPAQARKTLARAETSKSWGIGMELGAVGFALRVVHPYYQENSLIGYMEYGEDINPLIGRLKNQTGNPVAMLVKKTDIGADQWRSYRESLGLRDNYDDLKDFVILGTTDEKIIGPGSRCFTEQMLESLPDTGGPLGEFEMFDKKYSCGGFAFADTNGGKNGLVVIARDTTTEIANLNRTNLSLLAISVISTLLLTLLLIKIANKLIVNPLRKLIEAAQDIQGGNLSSEIHAETNDEIGELAMAFNGMRERLNYSYGSLEDLVRQKTLKLSETLEEATKKNVSLENSKRAMLNVLEDFEESKKIIEHEKIKYESERDRSEGILRYLHAIGEGVIATDMKGNLIFVNLTAAKMIGRTEGSPLIGKNYLKEFPFFWGSGKEAKVIDPTGETLKRSGVYVLPSDCYLVAGPSKIPVAGSFAPIIKEDKVLGIVSVFQDITERYKLEKEKDDFLSIAAHQLRTPLSGVRWMIEMLLEGDAGELPKEATETLQQIFDNNQRLIVLVNDLLDVSRINMGGSQEEPTMVDITETLNGALKALSGLAQERGINVKLEKLCPENPKVNAGPTHLFQAFENIISNAVKYTPNGGTVKVSIDIKDKSVMVAIADTGIGIPKKEQEKVFEKFFRASNATLKETEGSGLGLNVVKSFIEESSGKIWFQSKEGKGTTFFVELPVFREK